MLLIDKVLNETNPHVTMLELDANRLDGFQKRHEIGLKPSCEFDVAVQHACCGRVEAIDTAGSDDGLHSYMLAMPIEHLVAASIQSCFSFLNGKIS